MGIVTGPTNGNKSINFWSDPVTDTDYRSFFYFLSIAEYGILRDLSALLIQLPIAFTKLAEMTDVNKETDPLLYGSDLGDSQIRYPGHFWLRQLKFKQPNALAVGGGVCCQAAL